MAELSTEGNQAGYAMIAAAFITGLWTWIAQKVKTKGEDEKQDKEDEKEDLDFGVQDRQNLVQGYREFNEQLQSRMRTMNGEISSLWTRIYEMQKSLEECEKGRSDDLKRFIVLERKMNEQSLKMDNQKDKLDKYIDDNGNQK